MNILVTLDRNYLKPLGVLLTSLFVNSVDETLDIYIISDDITDGDLAAVSALCARFHASLHLLHVGEDWFADAPTVRYYARAMYYRLLAAQILPEELERILYLDPDMLVINPLGELYKTEMGGKLFAACMHKGLVNLSGPVNKLRLSNYETEGYYNSGMLLMNLPAIRREVKPEDVFSYVQKNRQLLVLPDQDILNGLYGERILPVDESLYNYDARKFKEYLIASAREMDMDWVVANTAILHFCGKSKPWNRGYSRRFSALYKHYMRLYERFSECLASPEIRL